MIPGGQFQVETVRRLLGSSDGLSAVYALSVDRPAWNAISELAREGASVKVLCRAAAAPEIRQLAHTLPTLSVQEVPAGVIHFANRQPLILIRCW